MFLTHRDDVCEHAKWGEALGTERILHKGETSSRQGTECACCECILLFQGAQQACQASAENS